MNRKFTPIETFLVHFEQLKKATKDSPERLIALFRSSDELSAVAENADRLYRGIEAAELVNKLNAQAPSGWRQARIDFRKYWRLPCKYVAEYDLNASISEALGFEPSTFDAFAKLESESLLRRGEFEEVDPDLEEDFDPLRHNGGTAIIQMIELLEDLNQGEIDPHIFTAVGMGLDGFRFLTDTIGLDLETAFRRWNLVKATYAQKHVSNKHAVASKTSLFGLHKEAVRAFIFDQPVAMLSLCRAILERVLKDHYLVGQVKRGDSLDDLIILASKRYDFVHGDTMHSLRKQANGLLHSSGGKNTEVLGDETALLKFLSDLTFWIEKAPER